MKPIISKLLFSSLIVAATGIASCTNEEATITGDNVAVRISGEAGTRAVNNTWNRNDAIGITMLKDGSAEVIAPYNNYNYATADGTENFAPATSAQIMYFPVDGSKVSFKAYYPYSSALPADMMMPVSVTDQSNLAAIDLMTAKHTAGTSKDDPNVHLHFYHRLAKVLINLTVEDSGQMSLNGCKLAIKGLKTTGTYDIMGEELKIDENSRQDVFIPIHNAHGEGIILPREAGEGVTFEITTADGGIYTAIMASDLKIESGTKHTFNINLKKAPVTVSATIEEWKGGPETPVNVVRVVTGLNASAGVEAGDTLRLLLKDEGDAGHKYAAKYTYNGEGNWATDNNIYWEDIAADPASFIGTTVITPKLNDTQMDDVLLSAPTAASQYTGVNLELKHAAAKTTVTLTSPQGDDGFTPEELAGAVITFPNYKHTGEVNEKGEFIISDDTHDITAKSTADGSSQVAIFPEQSINAGDVIAVVTIGRRNYEIKHSDEIVFEAGANNKLNINISKTAVGVSTTVTDWDNSKAAHEIVFKVDVANGMTQYFQANDVIRFYQVSGGNVAKSETGTCTAGDNAAVIFPNSPWKVEAFAQGDVISAVFPSTLTTVGEGEDSFGWTSFDTTKGKNEDDILIATHKFATTPDASSYTNVPLAFKHVLSKVTVNIIAGEGFTETDFEGKKHSIALLKFILKGTINVATGIATPTGGAIDSFVPEKLTSTTSGSVATYEALIMPQEINKETKLITVELNAQPYTIKASDFAGFTGESMSFVAGSNHTINITFKKTGISLSTTVEPWTDGQGGDITIQ